MTTYQYFVLSIQQSDRNIMIAFYAALAIILSMIVLGWLPPKWIKPARVLFLAWLLGLYFFIPVYFK